MGYEKIINVYGKAGTLIFLVDWFHSATPNINKIQDIFLRVTLCKNFSDDLIEERKQISEHYKGKDDFLAFIFGSDRRWYKEVELNSHMNPDEIEFYSPKTNEE